MFIFINDSRTSAHFFLLLRKERTGAKAKNQRERGFTRHNEAQILNLRYGDAQAASDYTVPKI